MSSYNALYPPNVGAQSAESIITPAMPGSILQSSILQLTNLHIHIDVQQNVL